MKLIAHRGNISGPNLHLENSPQYIDTALQKYDAEIDLRVVDDQLYLGHDIPQHPITLSWLEDRSSKLWIHCKNREALQYCLQNNLHCFWHNIDDYTITSKGYVWAYPGKENVGDKCILVMPETHWNLEESKKHIHYGVCSDFVEHYY